MFEKASRLGLLFPTAVGNITDRDLWHLPLTGIMSLNDIAKDLNKVVKNQEEEDFVNISTTNNDNIPQLRLDIVKRIIEYKLAMRDRNEKKVKTQQRNERIIAIKAEKEDGDLKSMSIEELDNLLEE